MPRRFGAATEPTRRPPTRRSTSTPSPAASVTASTLHLRYALSAEALGGVGIGNFSGASKGLTYVQTGFWQDAARPAFIINLAGDINIFPNLAFRIAPTYVGTTFTSPLAVRCRTASASTPASSTASAARNNLIQGVR